MEIGGDDRISAETAGIENRRVVAEVLSGRRTALQQANCKAKKQGLLAPGGVAEQSVIVG